MDSTPPIEINMIPTSVTWLTVSLKNSQPIAAEKTTLLY
jgi:hypothetical protein